MHSASDDEQPSESLFGSADGAGPDASRRPARRKRQPLSATQRALGLLTRREHSHQELVRKLVSRGLDPEEVESAVAKLATDGWQSDERFAESLLRSRAGNGYGPFHIRSELSLHGLGDDLVERAFDSFEGDWLEIACDMVRRRCGEELGEDPELRRKASDLLTRRGFPGDLIRRVVRGGDD